MYSIWDWNYKAFRVVFQEIYAADKKTYATAGRTGRAKYQLCDAVSGIILNQTIQLLLLDIYRWLISAAHCMVNFSNIF